MADNRTMAQMLQAPIMAQMLQAPIEGYEDAIVIPPINANNFELKQPLINLVQSNKFTGRQDPHNKFTGRHPEVPNTSVKLLLFPFSLDGEARDWLDKEPPRSILTWDDLVSKFINQYFPPSKTTYYRNEIITFYQKPNEAFNEAWERFKGLLHQCPHHGFSELHQLDTFYNSLNSNDQDALDSAAGGNFLDKMPQEGLAIIESKSKVRYSRSRANDPRVSTDAPLSNNSFEMQQIAASLEDKMTIKMNKIMNEMKALVVTTPAPVKAVEERCTTCGNNHSFNVCPMTRGGYEYPVYHDNFQQFQQTASVGNFVQMKFRVNSWTNSGLSQQAQAYQVPSTQAPVTYSRFEAYTTANDATLNNLQKNLNEFKKEQQDFQNEQRNFQNMMLNMFQKQMGNSNASSSGTLPSNTITNPRCEARAITTRSGLSYTPVPPIPPPLYDENEPLTEKETEVTKDKVLPSTKDIQPPVIQKSHDPVKPVSSPISPEPSSAQVDNSPPSKEPSKETKLPYPSRVEHEKKGENDKVQIQKFWEMFKKIHVDITLADALILMPKYQKMLKSLLSNKEKLNEMANTPVSETCSAIILKKLPEKLGDPGQFLIPCNFSELKCKALADLGASINLMPFSVYTKLGLPALQSTRMTLELANCSLCVPKGIARDVLVPVGGFNFPADFVVVDFECNYRVPLILGRPFLRTARVLIDVHGEELVIRDGMERIVFKPDGSQDKESIHMMDIYDDRVKDVCEPKSNDDSPTSTIVEEFESLLGDIIRQKEEVKGISDPVARRKACFLDKFKITNQGRVIHSPKKASISAISHIFPNNNLEDSFKMGNEDLNFIPNKELDKEILIPIPRESKIGKDCDFPLGDDFQSFKTFSNPLFEKQDDFPSRNDESILKEEVHTENLKSHLNPLFKKDKEIISNEASRQISPKVDVKTIVSFFSQIGNCVRKWATSEVEKDNDEVNHEVFKSENENDLGVHDNEEEEISFLDGLLEDENFFEINDKKVEFLERKAKEDFETKVEPKFKQELQVFHPDIEILNHFETTSYVGSDYVFLEDFSLVDMIFPMNIPGKIFDPGIPFHGKSFENDTFKDKSSKELAPSKALLTTRRVL
ncbi:reverse transcriptase domain-containing protein [Tanacetum coccineum]